MTNKLILFFFLFPLLSFSQLTTKDNDILRQELSERINNLRISHGLQPLLFNDTLYKAAEFHSEYMAKNDVLGHDEKQSKYRTPEKRVAAFEGKNFELIGENVLYSTAQVFPLKKKDLIALADEMFNAWKDSPGHYANMIEPDYVCGDLAFATNKKKGIVYATQVFGTKGYVVPNQLSKNSFGLTKAPDDCETSFEAHSNLILNMGNSVRIEGNEVILYHHDIAQFKQIFSGPKDGIAVDLVSPEQLACGTPNQLDFSPIYDGILLKPIYSPEMLANNRAEGDFRFITKVGEIPENLAGNEYLPSLIIIKNGKACKYVCTAEIPRQDCELRSFEPTVLDEPLVKLVKEGIVESKIIVYDFKTDNTNSVDLPKTREYAGKIHSIHINSFSSVEGDSIHNAQLHNSRANFIKNQLSSALGVAPDKFTINAKENWDQMNFQLNYFGRFDLAQLSHDSLKMFLIKGDSTLAWDSLLYAQRKSIAIINYKGSFSENGESLGAFNLRTAVAKNDLALANKALYSMYHSGNYNPEILFEPQIMEFIKMQPKTVANYSALLSKEYFYNPYLVTDFIHSWLHRIDRLDANAQANILHLYTLTGKYLLENWDITAERLSNVIHPSKIEGFRSANVSPELLLNLQITYINYYDRVNDYPNLEKSFQYIADYFQAKSLDQKAEVDLALFFNYWSAYNKTVEYLSARFRADGLNEDGIFVLAQTMNLTNYEDDTGLYLEVQKKAFKSNQERWCEWIFYDYQVKRNRLLKKMYCESCSNWDALEK